MSWADMKDGLWSRSERSIFGAFSQWVLRDREIRDLLLVERGEKIWDKTADPWIVGVADEKPLLGSPEKSVQLIVSNETHKGSEVVWKDMSIELPLFRVNSVGRVTDLTTYIKVGPFLVVREQLHERPDEVFVFLLKNEITTVPGDQWFVSSFHEFYENFRQDSALLTSSF